MRPTAGYDVDVDNPFLYSKPVPPAELIDRRREIEQLRSLLGGGHNCRLSAPRRYGKTSLVNAVRSEAERDGAATVYANFYGILSLADATARLERAYRELRGPLARWMTGRLESLRLSLATPLGSLELAAGPRREPEQLLHELLELPRQIHAKTGRPVLVCFDEFQAVLSTRIALDGAIRSVIEQHHDQAAYLFAGSHPGMMRALFEDRERPFYGQARAVALDPLAAEDLADHIGERFQRTGRDVGGSLRPLLALARGHPQRAMMLAHFLWELTPQDGAADESTFAQALALVMDELSEAFERTWRSLDDGERRTLAAIVLSDGQPTRAAALDAADVPRTTVHDAIQRLQDEGQLSRRGARLELVDPLLARWIEHGRPEA